tara:strand:- start:8992 stop:10149 length:1158 start_codon:yes stop_codon:yes gene_type:complete
MEMDVSGPVLRPQEASLLIPFLLSLPGLGVVSYWQLRQHSLPLDRLMTQPLESLLPMIPKTARPDFERFYHQGTDSQVWRQFEQTHQRLLQQEVICLTHEDARFPSSLSNICQSPPLLYVKGAVELLDAPQIAFVGSRKASQSGSQTARRFARFLADAGIAITSGLAAGIDAAAHQGAIEANGKTIAVMGTGIDRIYPRGHQALADQILQKGGALVSEFMPGTAPHAGNFPRRNRIISGLSLGVLVVEAALKSGSLITARYALEQNREVYAIPGSIHNPLSRGCHSLIREGATLVETAEDIARELTAWCNPTAARQESQDSEEKETLSEVELSVLDAIAFDVCTIDQLAERSNIATSILLAIVMQLELKGLISQSDGHIERLSNG